MAARRRVDRRAEPARAAADPAFKAAAEGGSAKVEAVAAPAAPAKSHFVDQKIVKSARPDLGAARRREKALPRRAGSRDSRPDGSFDKFFAGWTGCGQRTRRGGPLRAPLIATMYQVTFSAQAMHELNQLDQLAQDAQLEVLGQAGIQQVAHR